MITFAALPMITRLYSPEDFALLAVYLSLVSTIAVAACLRFEIAIPLADTEIDAKALLILAFMALLCVVLIVLLLVLLVPRRISTFVGNPEIATYLWLVPMGIAFVGSYSILQFWTTRARRFGVIAQTRVSQAVAGVTTILALGWAGVVPFGLLLGNMLNIGAGSLSLAVSVWQFDKIKLQAVPLSILSQTLRRYRRYPVFSTPEALFNIAGVQVSVLLIAVYNGTEAGFLFLAMQVMTAPMKLLGNSISQVYMSRALEEMRKGRLAPFTLSIMWRLVLLGMVPLVLVGALAPSLTPWVFGPEWIRAGEIITLLVPWMLLQFIASPVSMVMFVVGRQRAMLVLTTFGMVLRLAGIALAVNFQYSLVGVFAMSSAFFYAICCATFIHAAYAEKKL